MTLTLILPGGLINTSEIRLEGVLGQGTFGAVHRAILKRRAEVPPRYVAVKSLLCADMTVLAEEAKLSTQMTPHPNVVQFIGFALGGSSPDSNAGSGAVGNASIVSSIVDGGQEMDKFLHKTHQTLVSRRDPRWMKYLQVLSLP